MSEQNKNRATLEEMLAQAMGRAFVAAFPDLTPSNISVTATTQPEFGQYQCNNAMSLAKQLKQKPRDIAQKVLDSMTMPASIERIDIAGPGFLNIHLESEWLADRLEQAGADDRIGVPPVGSGRTIVMDYGSPNITKPLHIGHLRSPNIGSAIDRMYRFLDYKVIADNHLGDWGTQFGITIMGYRHFGDQKAMEEDPMQELERVYVRSYENSREDEEWLAQCREELVKLQGGDQGNRRIWKKFVELSVAEVDRLYSRMGVSFDITRGESYYHDKLSATVEALESKGVARESEGALVAFLDEEKLEPAIVRKSDGGFNYATTDIATVMSRVEEFEPEMILYITDERQQLHFRQIFAICRKLGHDVEFQHVWFGLMRMPDGVIKTRTGGAVKLEQMLDEAESRALAVVKESSPEMDEQQQKEVARAVGIGAVKYADLSQNPQSVVTFTWDKAMALDGNSGPYLQYACARISSVRDKYSERFPDTDPSEFPIVFTEDIEKMLAVKLLQFPETILRAARGFKPSTLTDYLYDLAQTYSTFYQNVPFLKAEEGIRESRVRLCDIVAKVLRQGLSLLGIETPERI